MMELAIDNRIKLSVLIGTMGAVIYGLGDFLPFGSELGWWAFDKINDRLYIVVLLSIASFAFTDTLTRLYCYAAMLYVIVRAYLEVVYIYEPFNNMDVYWCISGFYCIFVLLSYIAVKYVSGRRKL